MSLSQNPQAVRRRQLYASDPEWRARKLAENAADRAVMHAAGLKNRRVDGRREWRP